MNPGTRESPPGAGLSISGPVQFLFELEGWEVWIEPDPGRTKMPYYLEDQKKNHHWWWNPRTPWHLEGKVPEPVIQAALAHYKFFLTP